MSTASTRHWARISHSFSNKVGTFVDAATSCCGAFLDLIVALLPAAWLRPGSNGGRKSGQGLNAIIGALSLLVELRINLDRSPSLNRRRSRLPGLSLSQQLSRSVRSRRHRDRRHHLGARARYWRCSAQQSALKGSWPSRSPPSAGGKERACAGTRHSRPTLPRCGWARRRGR